MPALLSVLGPNHLPTTVLFPMLEAVHCLARVGGQPHPQGCNQILILTGSLRASLISVKAQSWGERRGEERVQLTVYP